MTIQQAIDRARLQADTELPDSELTRWLSLLDGQLYNEVVSHYAGNEGGEAPSYDEDTDPETELMVPAPYDDLYVYHLVMRIHLAHGDLDRYNAAAIMFNNCQKAWQRQYNNTHNYVNGKNQDGTYWVYGLRF